jgi:hypothetical protein
MAENQTLNQKAELELLLANAQGAIYMTPGGNYQSPHLKRFKKLADLAILALYASAYLSNETGFSSRLPNFASFIGGKVGRMVESPHLTFQSSFTNQHTWARLADSLSLSALLEEWRRRWQPHLTPSMALVTERLSDQWWEVEELGSILERQKGSADPLASVHPAELRELIRSDWSESQRCLATGNYRASIVMSGAAVEGILLAIATRNQVPQTGKSVYSKGIQELLRDCCPKYNEKIPPGDPIPTRYIATASASVIDNACRLWRNFIHPGLVLQDPGSATIEKARASLSALELLVTEL